jgi:gamma-glutamyltranspeptidase/glutathione hydrolase
VPDPNLPGPRKRPRSSMSPTIVLDGEQPVLALGSPGGASIITTVTQVLTEHLDRGLPLVEAIASPRISSRNGATTDAENAVVNGPTAPGWSRSGTSSSRSPSSARPPPSGCWTTGRSRPQPRPPDGVAARRWWCGHGADPAPIAWPSAAARARAVR